MKTVDIYNRKQKNDEVLTVKSVKEFCNEPFYFWDILQKKAATSWREAAAFLDDWL